MITAKRAATLRELVDDLAAAANELEDCLAGLEDEDTAREDREQLTDSFGIGVDEAASLAEKLKSTASPWRS